MRAFVRELTKQQQHKAPEMDDLVESELDLVEETQELLRVVDVVLNLHRKVFHFALVLSRLGICV